MSIVGSVGADHEVAMRRIAALLLVIGSAQVCHAQDEVARLRAALAASPDDLSARCELAFGLVGTLAC